MTKKQLHRFYKVVCFCIRLYILFALVWTICYIVSEIFEKMGVL